MVLASVSGSVYTSAKLLSNGGVIGSLVLWPPPFSEKKTRTFIHCTLYVALILYSHVYLFVVHIYTQLRMVAQKAL